MARLGTALGLGGACFAAALLGLGVAAARAAEGDFDNPGSGAAPCVVLSDLRLSRTPGDDGDLFATNATVANLCGRTMDVSACFRFHQAADVDPAAPACFGGVLRPWSSTRVALPGAPGPVVGSDLRWRWAPTAQP